MSKPRAASRTSKPPRSRRAAPSDLRALLGAWEQHLAEQAWSTPARFSEMGGLAMEYGHPTLAYEICRQGLTRFPADRGLLYRAALASAKIGSYVDTAGLIGALLSQLRTRDKLYMEAKSLEGRLAKDRWAKLAAGPEKDALGSDAASAYEAAYTASRSYFPGINAATMYLVTGRLERGRLLAEDILRRGAPSARGRARKDHWLLATLGEASLLLGDPEAALRWYRRAARAAGNRVGDIATMRRQLRLLQAALPVDPGLYQALEVPRVAVFSGHMLDRPGRVTPRFPAGIEKQVAARIAACLREQDLGFGYCSAACGADILFIEQMLKRGLEVHVVLPFDRQDFIATSVAFAGSQWLRRFEAALRGATSVSYAVRERYLGDGVLFDYTARLTQGEALLRARQLETEALLLCVVDTGEADGPGGTRTALAHWQGLGLPAVKVDLGAIRRASGELENKRREPQTAAEPAVRSDSTGRVVKTMLFADMVGFSKLNEADTPAFLVHFLGEIQRVIAGTAARPAFVNTWGDGLYMVFDEVVEAAEFALHLRDAVARTDWQAHALPADTSIRIGLHSGPVFPAVDPIIQRPNFFGSHVNRAARIEPVTAPGAIYVSEQTAALLAASAGHQVACDFLGSLPLAKHFGESVLYRLRRAQESE